VCSAVRSDGLGVLARVGQEPVSQRASFHTTAGALASSRSALLGAPPRPPPPIARCPLPVARCCQRPRLCPPHYAARVPAHSSSQLARPRQNNCSTACLRRATRRHGPRCCCQPGEGEGERKGLSVASPRLCPLLTAHCHRSADSEAEAPPSRTRRSRLP